MTDLQDAKLVSKAEIDTAVALWNALSSEEITTTDPFGGKLGRSGAAAYNFLLLATFPRKWKEPFLVNAAKQMKNHGDPNKNLSRNKDHIEHLVTRPDRQVSGVQPLERLTPTDFRVNSRVLPFISFEYLGAAISD
jgi:hypothetical protein